MDINNRGAPKPLRRALAVLLAVLLAFAPATALADMQGIDVSGWQTADVTCRVSGDFAIVKVTGGLGYENPRWRAQVRCATDTGKEIGLYHYAGDGSGGAASAEADRFVASVRPYVGRAVLALDWEAEGNPHWGNGDWVRQFVQRVHALTGVWPVVYTSASAIGQIPSDVRANCGLWVAQYASNAATGYQASPWLAGAYGEALRQYTSNGRLAGYDGPLDLNVFWGDRTAWRKYAVPVGQASAQPSSPATPATSGDGGGSPSQCVTVQAGDTLSSIAATHGGTWSDWTGYQSGTPSLIYAGETVCRDGSSSGNSGSTSTGATGVTVRSGDTMSAIAARTGLWPLSAWSVPSGDLNRIWPGQTVTYHGAGTTTTGGARTVTVRAGDTLSGIAARLGIAWTQLTGYRSGNPNVIYPGEVLRY